MLPALHRPYSSSSSSLHRCIPLDTTYLLTRPLPCREIPRCDTSPSTVLRRRREREYSVSHNLAPPPPFLPPSVIRPSVTMTRRPNTHTHANPSTTACARLTALSLPSTLCAPAVNTPHKRLVSRCGRGSWLAGGRGEGRRREARGERREEKGERELCFWRK